MSADLSTGDLLTQIEVRTANSHTAQHKNSPSGQELTRGVFSSHGTLPSEQCLQTVTPLVFDITESMYFLLKAVTEDL